RVERPGDDTVVRERLDGLERHGVDRVGADQFLDVDDVPIGGVLRGCARPEWPLDARSVIREPGEPLGAEDLLEPSVRQLRVRDRGTTSKAEKTVAKRR